MSVTLAAGFLVWLFWPGLPLGDRRLLLIVLVAVAGYEGIVLAHQMLVHGGW